MIYKVGLWLIHKKSSLAIHSTTRVYVYANTYANINRSEKDKAGVGEVQETNYYKKIDELMHDSLYVLSIRKLTK
jgi:hypothetical protein